MRKRGKLQQTEVAATAGEVFAALPTESNSIASGSPDRFLIPCLFLFAASGCAALIYEIVWFQLLELVIGSSGVSLGLLLAAYMGGLCLGGALLGKLVSPALHPFRAYACIEFGVAAFGIAALFGVPLVSRIYAAMAGGGGSIILRGAIAAACLLPPTFLMGASLPAMARWVRTTPGGVSWLGWLYSANIAGAVLGCLAAGFYLLRVFDLQIATFAAATLNIAAGIIALALAARAPHQTSDIAEPVAEPNPSPTLIYAVIALSGLTALGSEVVWTRLLSLLLGGTVYTFSIILAVFLIGLWAGSAAGAFLARRLHRPPWALAGCQFLLATAIAFTAFTMVHVMPYWPVDPWLALNPWINFDLDLMRCIRTILPATLLWGASFPLALAAAASPGEDSARLSGSIYAINTAGSIIGALAFSLVLIPAWGTQASEQTLIWIASAGAAIAMIAAGITTPNRMRIAIGGAIAAAVMAPLLASSVGALPWQAIAYGRRIAPILRGNAESLGSDTQPVYVGEGLNSSVVIAQRGTQRFFYVSGKSEASSAPVDMRLQRMMGHMPALLHAAPHSVLVVGFGAGVTAGSFVDYPEVQKITICELEPLIPPASDTYFGEENRHVLRDPRTTVVTDDARHYILTTNEKFDVITTDPIHPWVKGTSSLYSAEYYELVKQHLNPGGVVAQWLPVYESDKETVATELATFFSAFPNATVWSNHMQGEGYDLVLIGRLEEKPIDVDALAQRSNQASYKNVARSLAEVQFPSSVDLLASYAGRARDLAPMVAGVPVNHDLNLRLQYLAGWGLNTADTSGIYRDLLGYRKFPADLFVGQGERFEQLRARLNRLYRTF